VLLTALVTALVAVLAAGAAGVTCETVDDTGVVRAAGLTALVTVLVPPVAASAAVLAAELAVPVTVLAVPVAAPVAEPTAVVAAPVAVLAAPVTVLDTEDKTEPGSPELGGTVAASAGVAASRPMPTRRHRPPSAAPTVYESTFRAGRHQPFTSVTLITENVDVHTRDAISVIFSSGGRIIRSGCDALCFPGLSGDS
jgi:hypothetical protein